MSADRAKRRALCHSAVARATMKGELSPIATRTCAICGKKAGTYHHHTYREGHELDVAPVCFWHHQEIHANRVPDPTTDHVWCDICDEAADCGHDRPSKEEMKPLPVTVPARLIEDLKLEAQRAGVPLAWLVRHLLETRPDNAWRFGLEGE